MSAAYAYSEQTRKLLHCFFCILIFSSIPSNARLLSLASLGLGPEKPQQCNDIKISHFSAVDMDGFWQQKHSTDFVRGLPYMTYTLKGGGGRSPKSRQKERGCANSVCDKGGGGQKIRKFDVIVIYGRPTTLGDSLLFICKQGFV